MNSSPVNKQSQYRSLERERESVCLARLELPGELGIDRLSVMFEVTAGRILVATVQDLLTQETLVTRQSIDRSVNLIL